MRERGGSGWLGGVCGLLLALAVLTPAARAATAVRVAESSADLTERMSGRPSLGFGSAAPARGTPVIHVNDAVRYQRISGFGAAMTDSSAWLLDHGLDSATRTSVLGALFGSGGLGLDFVRLPIGASDFTSGGQPYSYDDLPPGHSDNALAHFSIAHDEDYVIPMLRAARAVNPRTSFLGSPWSPPAWMKSNGSLANVKHAGTLRRGAGWPWAQYIVKFLQAYARAGVPVSAITPQNEPTNATAYPGLELPVATEASWILHDLVPALRGAGLRTLIYGDDWGWGPRATAYAERLIKTPAAAALAGLAWHCYFGTPNLMSTVRRLAPRLDPIVDECSPGITPFPTTEVAISALRNWASTVALWNLALDPHGGPVEAPNGGCFGCTGLVTIDPTGHTAAFGPDYYQLGQLSAFVKPGASRIDSEHFVSYAYKRSGTNLVTPGLDDVAFLNPDGTRVLVAYDNAGWPITFAVSWRGQSFTYTLAPGSTVTFRWR